MAGKLKLSKELFKMLCPLSFYENLDCFISTLLMLPKLCFKNIRRLTVQTLKKLCPLAFCESFESFTSVLLILPKLCVRNVLVLLFIYVYYGLNIADGLLYRLIDTRFLFLPVSSLGSFLNSIASGPLVLLRWS